MKHNEQDEVFWIMFLASLIGDNSDGNWDLLEAIYTSFNEDKVWNWKQVLYNFEGFEEWIKSN